MRAIIVSLLGFGGGVGLLVFIVTLVIKGDQHAFQYGLNAGLLIGGIFSILLVGVLLPLDLTAHLFLSQGKYKELWELEQTREVAFEGTLKDVLAVCRQALLTVSHIGAIAEDTENLVVTASVGASWRSGGEIMQVEINPISPDKWQLCCTSRSKSEPVLFDYGKNFENVEAWLKAMDSRNLMQQPS